MARSRAHMRRASGRYSGPSGFKMGYRWEIRQIIKYVDTLLFRGDTFLTH